VPDRPLVVVSNRGPLSFTLADDGSLRTRKAGGGLVNAIGPALDGSAGEGQATDWIAAALSDADRVAARSGAVEADGYRLHSVLPDPDDYRQYYDVVSNRTLWFLHHGLWDAARSPVFDAAWWRAWDAYRRVNDAFADVVCDQAPEGAVALVQDYHLALLGPALAEKRPDLAAIHFHHTPFAPADALRVLPERVARELFEGLAAYRACGFHSARWAANFEVGAEQVLGRVPLTFVSPAAADADDIRAVAAGEACATASAELHAQVGERLLVVRVDRIELSKNIVRGFLAYDELLRTRPEWRGRVTFGAFVYPSREGVPEYLQYRDEVEATIGRINAEWGTADWTPILYDPGDDFPRSIAALRRYDALLVNPIRDGLNLVAKEGPIVNERDGVLLLSPECGAWAELGDAAIEVPPYDVSATAEALHAALSMPADARRRHADEVRRLATARTAHDWLGDQIRAAVS
jgi:trehalose 6-phosphate synthase